MKLRKLDKKRIGSHPIIVLRTIKKGTVKCEPKIQIIFVIPPSDFVNLHFEVKKRLVTFEYVFLKASRAGI